MSRSLKFVATVEPVREVILEGRADPGYWQHQLDAHGLDAQRVDGQARLMIGAFSARWMGIAFREAIVVVAIEASEADARIAEHWYQTIGINQNRFFAFVERVRFKTPYERGRVEVQVGDNAAFTLLTRGAGRLAAQRAGTLPAPPDERTSETHRIALPSGRGRHFHARFEAHRITTPFDAVLGDRFSLEAGDTPAFQALEASHFKPTTWHIASDSLHARTATSP